MHNGASSNTEGACREFPKASAQATWGELSGFKVEDHSQDPCTVTRARAVWCDHATPAQV